VRAQLLLRREHHELLLQALGVLAGVVVGLEVACDDDAGD
jgi:hypothetical protein